MASSPYVWSFLRRGQRLRSDLPHHGPGVEADLGQRFIVESKPGADGAIGTAEVVRAAA